MSSRIFIVPLIALTCLALSACGFQPVYGTNNPFSSSDNTEDIATENLLGQIYISNIPDREGQMLRNELIDRFYVYGAPTSPLFTLEIQEIREQQRKLDITISSDATREQLTLETQFTLREKDSGEILLIRPIKAITSYNVLQSQFTTRVSENNSRKNAIAELARQIETQITLYMKDTLDGQPRPVPEATTP